MITAFVYVAFAVIGLGSLWLAYRAFCESPIWGVVCLLVPGASLLFVILHWDVAAGPFLVVVVGVGLVIGAAVLDSRRAQTAAPTEEVGAPAR